MVLGERPLVAETPEHMLDDDTTPTDKFFVRNNGMIPDEAKEPEAWKIVVDGEVNQKLELTLGELKSRFRPVTQRMVLECGGNGRSFFAPQARGNQWTNGGAAAPNGPACGSSMCCRPPASSPPRSSPATTAPTAAWRTPARTRSPRRADQEGDGRQQSHRVRHERAAADEHSRRAGAAGDPGRPGSVSSKWFTRIFVRDKVHDGPGMGGTSYRVAINPMIPGDKPDDRNFRDLESMPVRSIITSPMNGTSFGKEVREVSLRGAAWAGDLTVQRVDVSIDFGASWTPAQLSPPKNPYDWQRWTATVRLPSEGYYEVWTRGTDSRGIMQPHIAGNWNPQGYGGNPMHRVAIRVA